MILRLEGGVVGLVGGRVFRGLREGVGGSVSYAFEQEKCFCWYYNAGTVAWPRVRCYARGESCYDAGCFDSRFAACRCSQSPWHRLSPGAAEEGRGGGGDH